MLRDRAVNLLVIPGFMLILPAILFLFFLLRLNRCFPVLCRQPHLDKSNFELWILDFKLKFLQISMCLCNANQCPWTHGVA